MTQRLKDLVKKGVLQSLDAHFARAMGRMSGEKNTDVLLAAALLSHQINRGHVCFSPLKVSLDELGLRADALRLPSEGWLEALATSPMVSDGLKNTPLVLADDRLYLHRYWQHEQKLAGYLQQAATHVDESVLGDVLKSGLDRLFPAVGGTDRQRLAAMMALRRRLCVISGGPGTGKTHTVVNILALLVEQALETGRQAPRITLVAPTGKAAARLVESIKKSKKNLQCSDKVKDSIVESASTLHRCLGAIAGSSTQFRHNRDNPLATDLVLVDEASMVNLGLMRRLVDALPPSARLILLGDMDQLSSIEAGAVLGDICNRGTVENYSVPFAEDIKTLVGEELELRDDAPKETGIWDCIVKLEKSYRFGADSGIAKLAQAINEGDSRRALEVIHSSPEISMHSSPSTAVSHCVDAATAGYSPYLKLDSIRDRLVHFDDYRVLCVRKTGSRGVVELNAKIELALARNGTISLQGENYDGRPVLINSNSYSLGLFNGDIGMISTQKEGPKAYFMGLDGSQRAFSPARLGLHETVFAMSVHKSQGSEFGCVAIVLPDEPTPVLTREVLYTAVTRAKKKVQIFGSEAMLRHAIDRPTVRNSGLRETLWGT